MELEELEEFQESRSSMNFEWKFLDDYEDFDLGGKGKGEKGKGKGKGGKEKEKDKGKEEGMVYI